MPLPHEVINETTGKPLCEYVPPCRPQHTGPREPTEAMRRVFGADCKLDPRTGRPEGELRPPTGDERRVFGADVFISPFSDLPVETGIGAPVHQLPPPPPPPEKVGGRNGR
jgi:hypothetical protein